MTSTNTTGKTALFDFDGVIADTEPIYELVGVPLSLTPESPKEQDGGEQVGFPARVGAEHQMEPCESGLR